MSFDLYIFDHPSLTHDDVDRVLESEESGDEGPQTLTPKLAEFSTEMMRRHPESDGDAFPWASWPLSESLGDGSCLSLNIQWDHAESLFGEIVELAHQSGLTVFDPQDDEAGIIPPD